MIFYHSILGFVISGLVVVFIFPDAHSTVVINTVTATLLQQNVELSKQFVAVWQ